MAKHAYYSPSSADGWMNCPQFEKKDGSNPAARWGTAVHEISHWALINDKNVEEFPHKTIDVDREVLTVDEDMFEHAAMYVSEVRARKGASALAWYESKIDISDITGEEDASGSADAVLIHEHNGVLEVIDLKTGQKAVSANAKQLRLYALGVYLRAMDLFDIAKIRATIVQTRHGLVKEHEYDVDELIAFQDEVRQAADRHRQKLPATPNWDACKWCAKNATCEALKKFSEAEAGVDGPFNNLDTTPASFEAQDLLARYEKLDAIKLYVEAIEAEIRRRVYSGDPSLPLKAVRGRKGPRTWVDTAKVMEQFKAWASGGVRNFSVSGVVKESPRSPKQVEQYLLEQKHPQYWERLQQMVKQSEGALTIVAQDDPRPAVRDNLFEDMTKGEDNE